MDARGALMGDDAVIDMPFTTLRSRKVIKRQIIYVIRTEEVDLGLIKL